MRDIFVLALIGFLIYRFFFYKRKRYCHCIDREIDSHPDKGRYRTRKAANRKNECYRKVDL